MLRVVKLFLVFTLFLAQSCKTKVETALEGTWSIDTIYYKGYNSRLCFYSNIVTFYDNGNIKLPYAGNRCPELISHSDDVNGIWILETGNESKADYPYKLKITTKNEVFSGSHYLLFYTDDVNNLLKFRFFSDSLIVIGRKGLFNYNKKIVEELAKETSLVNNE